jgi:hypothetical protein
MMNSKLKIFLAISAIVLATLACALPGSSSPQPSSESAPKPSGVAKPDLSGQMAVDKSGYPTAPEGVVKTFLTAYTLDPTQMNLYLSQNRLANMPAGGALEMLKLNGNMEGFVIESAAVSPATSAALVVVTVKAGGVESARTFKLVKNEGKWAIDAIEAGK